MKLFEKVRRAVRPAGKTVQAILRWKRLSFDEAPPLFGNSKPKSGSHLLLQILDGFTHIMPYRYVEADPIRTIRKEGGRRTTDEILADLDSTPRDVIGWGYVEAVEPITAFLTSAGRVNYFIYRDPRDLLVSQVFFATDMKDDHAMHAYYSSLPDFDARLKAAITGVNHDGLTMVSVRQRYAGVFDWLGQKNVMCIRFEDLIERREATLNSMLDEVQKTGYKIPTPRQEAVARLVESIAPRKSHTFRSGQVGGWKERFTSAHKKLFKQTAGDLLVRLGYEKNNDW